MPIRILRAILVTLLLAGLAAPARADQPAPAPDTSMAAGILVDYETGKVLWSKEARALRPPASLTKVLTALVVLERGRLDDKVLITPEMTAFPGASTGLRPGWRVRVADLLWGMLLQSGNDAAAALARRSSPDGTIAGFVSLMNERARELGALNTHFTNPHGLDEPGHVSTAFDLALLSMAAMRDEQFAEIVSAQRYQVAWGAEGAYTFYNVNKLLTRYEGAVGIKTGFTSEAGRNLVSAVSRDGATLIAVVMGAPDHYNESIAIFDWGFANLGPLRQSGTAEVRPLLPEPSRGLQLRGLEVVEYRPGVTRRSGPPPLLPPLFAVLTAIAIARLIRRRRPTGAAEPEPVA